MEKTVELLLDEYYMWAKYAYDKYLADILYKYKTRDLEAFAIDTSGLVIKHAFIFRGDRKLFAFQDGRKVSAATAVRTIEEMHQNGIIDEGKQVKNNILREIMLRDL